MKLGCYSVYDEKAQVFHPPFYAVNDAAATRTLADALMDKNTMFGRHPADYRLYNVGSFLDHSGLLEPISPPKFVVSAFSLVQGMAGEMPFPDNVTAARDFEERRRGGVGPRDDKEEDFNKIA